MTFRDAAREPLGSARTRAARPRRRAQAFALVALAAGGLGAAMPGVASAASLSLTVNPADVVAGRPSEFRFDIEHTSSSRLYTYSQPRTTPCAEKPSLQTFPEFTDYRNFDQGGKSFARTTQTFSAPSEFRICGYLQPRVDYPREQAPLAVGTWDIVVRAANAQLAVTGIPPTVPPGGIYDVTFTSTTEAPREVAYRLVAGPACAPNTASPSVFSRTDDVNGGPTVWTERVSLTTAPTGLYTWCGYVGGDLSEGSVDQVTSLGSVSIVAPPPPPPPPPPAPSPPACAVVTKSVKRGRTFSVRCYRITGSVRVRIKRRGRTVTRSVPLKRGVARVRTTRSTPAGRWKVSILGPTGKIGTGKVTVRRR